LVHVTTSQAIGWEEHPQNDLFFVKKLNQLVSPARVVNISVTVKYDEQYR